MSGPGLGVTRPSVLVATDGRACRSGRVPGETIGRALVVVAALTSTWTAVTFGGTGDGGIKPVDVLLLAAAAVGAPAVAAGFRAVPAWIWLPAVGLVVVLIVHVLFPTSPLQLAARTPLDAVGELLPSTPDGIGTTSVVARWLVALVVLPVLVVNLWGKRHVPLELLVWAWTVGAAVSAAVAVADFAGLTQIGPGLIGYAQQAGRQTGLASQPNHLGFACALAAPAAVHLLTRRGFRGVCGAVILALQAAGVVLSGSRGAQLGLLLVAVLTAALLLDLRRHLAVLTYAAAVGLLAVVAVGPRLLAEVGELLRFGGDPAAAQSDSIRLLHAEQAASDIAHRPVFGVGYQVLLEAHNIYLQVSAAGGAVLLCSLLVLVGGALRTSFRLAKSGDALAVALFGCVLTWALCGLIENQLTDRYLYVPISAIAALVVARRAGAHPQRERDVEPPDSPGSPGRGRAS